MSALKTQMPIMHSLLHWTAAIILLLFAALHFSGLAFPDYTSDSENTVFPFLTSRMMYLTAGIFELLTALVCLKFRGRDLANIVILVFVGIILWYRWALHFTSDGLAQCGCLGLLGKWLNVSRTQELLIPVIALILLTLTTTPWLYRMLASSCRQSSGCLPLSLLLFALPGAAHGEQTIEVHGEIDAARYAYKLGTPFTNTQVHVGFVATLSGDTYKICATNLNNSIWWGMIVHDGTNMFTLNPDGGHMWFNEPSKSNSIVATISPSSMYCPDEDDTLGLAAAWLTYGLSPQKVTPNEKGFVEFQLPWQTRSIGAISAYGYKWLINPEASARFMEDCQVVRDNSLDLSDKQELLRPASNYPTSRTHRNESSEALMRRRQITNGFVVARYQCTAWHRTNDMSIPATSEFMWFFTDSATSPGYRAKLRTTAVVVRSNTEALLPSPSLPTRIQDYRYKRANATHIFKYAEYTLQAGDDWKSDRDPVLLALAQDHLEHGRRYDDFGSGKNVFAWTLLAVLVMTPAIAMLWRKKPNKNKTNYRI